MPNGSQNVSRIINMLGASKQKVEVELDEAVAQFVSLSSATKFVKKPK